MWLQKHKLNIQLACVLLIIYAFYSYFVSRYKIGFNGALSDCLYSIVFLVDKWDQDVESGDLASFMMNKPNKYYEPGNAWIKKVVSTGKDHIQFDERAIYRNGELFAQNDMSWSLDKLGYSIDELNTDIQLNENEYFFVGETKTTYDSRYWGTVDGKDVIGKVYAIF